MLFNLRKQAESLDSLIAWLEKKARGRVRNYDYEIPNACALAQYFTEMFATSMGCNPSEYYETNDKHKSIPGTYRRLPRHFNWIVMGDGNDERETFAGALKRARAIRKRIEITLGNQKENERDRLHHRGDQYR
jgi:hypothetical protein